MLPQRDPLLVAKQAATVHHLSGGRMELGVGVGWIEQEYGYLRADFHGRGKLADEYIPAMRALFESDKPEFHGAHIDYSGVLFSPKPAVPLPIVVGGGSRAALKRAATLGGKAGPGLFGDAATLTKLVRQYAQAGVDELVIEPVATELDDFLDQITRFATEVASDRF